METEGLGCNLEEGMETQNSCEDCQNVQEASLSNVSKHKLTDDKHTIDSNGEQIAKMWKIIRKPSYVSKLLNSKENGDNKLCHVPTVINESGQEFVIFDDELVKEGSKKWEMSACGYFVGYRMYMQELNYHLYMMWRKFGLKHTLNNGNAIFVFKFNNAQGLQTVIESGP
ncbi:hypothetical protein Tco_1144110 [Tanacetum coccineum]